ncbi:MAG: hypothetical protein RL213_2224 [Bacteroidota bacterium]
MVGRYKRPDGVLLPSTRISNTTYVECPARLAIGDNVFIGHFNFIDASQGLIIGEGCQITNYVSILTHSSHISIRLYGPDYTGHKDHHGYVRGKVEIGAYTFVGPHSVIMPGSSIGKGSIVSAFSYVKGEFPDFSIISGNPAVRTGDTRDLDRPYLEKHPELMVLYQSWSKDESLRS